MGVEEALEVARDADPNALPTWVVDALRTLADEAQRQQASVYKVGAGVHEIMAKGLEEERAEVARLRAEVEQWRRTAAVLAQQVEAADAVADAWAQIPVEADVQEVHVEMAAAVERYREARR